MKSNKRTARIAGLIYLILIIAGVFANLVVRSSLIVPGDAAATANNIMASEWLFRLAYMSDLIMITCMVLLPLVLYVLLKPVNKNIALLMMIFALVSVPIMYTNMLNHFAPLLVLSGADYLTVFAADQLNAQAMLFLNLHEAGYNVIFFGLWLLPLGYLIYKSGYFPRILGVLVVIAGFSSMIDVCTFFLFPSYTEIISSVFMVPSAIGEFALCGWLLIRGAKIPETKS